MAARRNAQNNVPFVRAPPLFTTAAQSVRKEINHWIYYIGIQAQRNRTPSFLEVQQSTQQMETLLNNLETVDLTTPDSVEEFTTLAYATISLWEDMGYVRAREAAALRGHVNTLQTEWISFLEAEAAANEPEVINEDDDE